MEHVLFYDYKIVQAPEWTKRADIQAPPRGSMNPGVEAVSGSYMLTNFGEPRIAKDYDFEGKGITNPKLSKLMTTADVGPFKETGMRPALTSLTAIMADIKREQPEAYAQLKSWGMLNVRRKKTKRNRARPPAERGISNHSWGSAIDLSFKGHDVDTPDDNKVYFGLTLIAPIFNRHGWYWGAAFQGFEDAMHFEPGKALLEGWKSMV
jgi:hypothetical protein